MKKGQAFLEFIMTYGWIFMSSILIILVLFYLGVFNDSEQLPKADFVCANLDNGTAVFPAIMIAKQEAENNLKMNIVELFGNQTRARMNNSEGVMCDMRVEACEQSYAFCIDMTLIIPVNYTQWEDWRGEKYEE